jgi:hypothetical protein
MSGGSPAGGDASARSAGSFEDGTRLPWLLRLRPGEDAFHSRPSDVLPPQRASIDEALERMLEHHGIANAAERRRRVLNGDVHRLARSLRELHWDKLAERTGATAAHP